MSEGEARFPVVEIFGRTIQGEGGLIGQQSHFIRFGGCDYKCVWCDSLHAVLPQYLRHHSKLMPESDIIAAVKALGPSPWVTLSGGNPLLYEMESLVDALHDADYRVAVETQGTIYKEWACWVDLLTLSPKPPSSGNPTHPDHVELQKFIRQGNEMCLKVVVFDEQDYVYAKMIHDRYPKIPFYLSVGNNIKTELNEVEQSDTTETLLERLRWLAARTLEDPEMFDAVVLPQLHVLIWGNKQGV